MNNTALSILRIIPSILLITHGFQKFRMLVAGNLEFPSDPVGIGTTPTLILFTLGEFVAPILIILGFKTRIAAIVTAVVMFIDAFFVHNVVSGLNISLSAENAVLYMVIYVAIYMLGPGQYSLDKK